MLSTKIKQITKTAQNNKKVIENYFFMTVLQVLNSLFYLIIYPYLIRTLGAESYGLYVFGMSITTYFITFVSFGFDMPAIKEISLNQNDNQIKSHTISCIFTAKIYLEIFAAIIFSILVLCIPFLRENWIILTICFIGTIANIFLPQWYFQGIQKMRTVTFIQLGFKLISLPFIFIFIDSPDDAIIFALIATFSNIIGSFIATGIIIFNDKLSYCWKSISEIKVWYKDSLPFIGSNMIGMFRLKSIDIIMATCFGMKELAIYDLTVKICTIPTLLAYNINGSIFPKAINMLTPQLIKRIIRIEYLFSFISCLGIILLGKFAVNILGGEDMGEAYPLAIIYSLTIFTSLVVGGYIHFVFIPQKQYKLITLNQVIVTINTFIFIGLAYFLSWSISSIVIAFVLASLSEIIFCKLVINKLKLINRD